MTDHVTVVGAGVIGLCTAYRLRQRGLDVTVVDRGAAGEGATWGNAGWVVPSLSAPLAGPGAVSSALRALVDRDGAVRVSPAQALQAAPWLVRFARGCTPGGHLAGLRATAALARGAQEAFAALADEGVPFRLRRDGLLSVYLDPDHAAAGRAALAPLEEFGYPQPALLTGTELRALEPALTPAVQAGYLMPQEQAVDPVTLVRGLRDRLLADGVELREHWPVETVVRRGDRAIAVGGPLGQLATDHVVVAAGAWSQQLLRSLGASVPLQAGKGYGLTVSPRLPVTRSLYFPEGRIGAAPRDDGLRIAGVMDLTGLSGRLDGRRVAAVRRVAGRFLTELDLLPPRDVWCGLRSVTPDGLPVLGRLPGTANVTLGFGHAMLGITLGPLSGELLADVVMGDRPAVPLDAFRPDRFRRRTARPLATAAAGGAR